MQEVKILRLSTGEDVIAKAQAAQKAKLTSASAAPVAGGGAR